MEVWKCGSVEMKSLWIVLINYSLINSTSILPHFHTPTLMLYLVPSPIGNLQDITFRALEVLKKADLILAEDTRNSLKLLNHYQIIKPLTPYHQHNEHKVLRHLVDQMLQGKVMALLTDAGTPGISDPAFLLVRECIQVNIRVECLPGATAFVPALVNSGLPMNRFCFEGFLPVKKGTADLIKEIGDRRKDHGFL